MADIVNLRLFKKQKERKIKEQLADQNRKKHGRTKIEKEFEQRNQKKSDAFLDANRFQCDGDKTDI